MSDTRTEKRVVAQYEYIGGPVTKPITVWLDLRAEFTSAEKALDEVTAHANRHIDNSSVTGRVRVIERVVTTVETEIVRHTVSKED